MKLRLFSLLSALFLLINAHAQEPSTSIKPQAGDKGLVLNLNGLIDNVSLQTFDNQIGQNILFGKYYLTEEKVVRVGFGLSILSANRNQQDSVGNTLVIRDSSLSNYAINIGGGIEKHFGGTKRLDPFIFSQLDITFIGKSNLEITTDVESNIGTDKTVRTVKQDGGIGFSITAGGGFNYFVAQKFSVGTEFGFALQYTSIGGTISDNTINTPVNGNGSSTFIRREDQTNRFEFDMQPNALVNLSYFF